MDFVALNSYFDQRSAEMLELIGHYVNQETPSTDKALCDHFAEGLVAQLDGLGGHTELVTSETHGQHVVAHFAPPNTPLERAPVLILCHYDTVWPAGTVAARPFVVRDRRAYGPGVFDMKSSLVLFSYALRACLDLELPLQRPLTLLVTSDEEVGSPTGRALIEAEAHQAALVLVLEPPLADGSLKTARKGVGLFKLVIEGRSAHAGVEPERGVSAITEAAHQIFALNALANPAAGTTINVGVIQGGTRTNVVPASAHLEIDVRAWTATEAERVTTGILQSQPNLVGITLRSSGGFNRPPMERSATTAALVQEVQRLAAGLGFELGEGGTGGGSDGNFTAALGVPTLDGLGMLGAGAHAIDEQIYLEWLPRRAALVAAILASL